MVRNIPMRSRAVLKISLSFDLPGSLRCFIEGQECKSFAVRLISLDGMSDSSVIDTVRGTYILTERE
jgi:hypothetical protein